MEFSRQEYWSGLLFPSPEDLPDPGITPWSPKLQADSLPSELPRSLVQFSRSLMSDSLCLVLAWEISWTEKPGGLQSTGLQRVGHNGVTSLSLSLHFSSLFLAQFSSVAQSCPTLCDPMNPSTLGLPVHHQLPEFTQTHVHRVGDAIQPSHPLSSPSPLAPNPSQHQSLFQ